MLNSFLTLLRALNQLFNRSELKMSNLLHWFYLLVREGKKILVIYVNIKSVVSGPLFCSLCSPEKSAWLVSSLQVCSHLSNPFLGHPVCHILYPLLLLHDFFVLAFTYFTLLILSVVCLSHWNINSMRAGIFSSFIHCYSLCIQISTWHRVDMQ